MVVRVLALPFVVRRSGGAVLGVQWLEGPQFHSDRVVDSSSWLVLEARGSGLGKQMRTAVLELAFGHLSAVAAVSSAVLGNAARSVSHGRSAPGRPQVGPGAQSGETLQHLRLERSAWVDWPWPGGFGVGAGGRTAVGLGDERA